MVLPWKGGINMQNLYSYKCMPSYNLLNLPMSSSGAYGVVMKCRHKVSIVNVCAVCASLST